jgi:hypothetical protein
MPMIHLCRRQRVAGGKALDYLSGSGFLSSESVMHIALMMINGSQKKKGMALAP